MTAAALEQPDLSEAELRELVPGPVFATGGTVVGQAGTDRLYATGRGPLRLVARAHAEPLGHGDGARRCVVVTALPPGLRKGGRDGAISQLVGRARSLGLVDLRDEPDRRGMRIVLTPQAGMSAPELRRRARRTTRLQQTRRFALPAANLRGALLAWIAARRSLLADGVAEELGTIAALADARRTLLIARTPPLVGRGA